MSSNGKTRGVHDEGEQPQPEQKEEKPAFGISLEDSGGFLSVDILWNDSEIPVPGYSSVQQNIKLSKCIVCSYYKRMNRNVYTCTNRKNLIIRRIYITCPNRKNICKSILQPYADLFRIRSRMTTLNRHNQIMCTNKLRIYTSVIFIAKPILTSRGASKLTSS